MSADSTTLQLTFGFDLRPKTAPREPLRLRLDELGVSGYQDLYQQLLNNAPDWETKFWSQHPQRKRNWWRKAAFIAWSCAPRSERLPQTLEDLADKLGVNRTTVYGWRRESPEIDETIARLQFAVLNTYLADVDWVTIQQAINPDSSTAQREMFYRRYRDAQQALAEAGGAGAARGETEAELDKEIEWLEAELEAG